MSFLKKMLKDAVNEGINKGIKEAVSAATEKIVAPKAEQFANKVANSLDEASKDVEENQTTEKKSNFSSLENALNKMAAAAEKYAETLEVAAQSQEDLTKLFEEHVPGMPVWCFGGKNFGFSEVGTDANGDPYYYFEAEGCTQEQLDLYVQLLKENGFVRKYPTSDEVLYKDLGGEYLVFGKTTAFESDPVMSLGMYRTKDKSEIEI